MVLWPADSVLALFWENLFTIDLWRFFSHFIYSLWALVLLNPFIHSVNKNTYYREGTVGSWRWCKIKTMFALRYHWLYLIKLLTPSLLQFSSVTQSCLTPCNPMNHSIPGLPVYHQLQSLPKLMCIESVMPSSHLILCRPLLLLPPIPPSIRVFSNESTLCMRWPKYWSFSLSISPSNEHPGLVSFRIDWLDLLAVQGTRESLLQHHSSKASILWCSAFFTVQLSHPYMTTGKTIALTRRTFVGKVMSLVFNTLSRLVITFLPRSKRLLISWL